MKQTRGFYYTVPYLSYALTACFTFGCLMGIAPTLAQNTAQKGTKATQAKPAPPAKKPALTQAEVQQLWAQGDQDGFMAQFNVRGLGFKPEEEWVNQLPKATGVPRSTMPLAAAALDAKIEPGPSVDDVASQAPDLLAKVKEAAQKRSDKDLAPLLHPDLFANNKAGIYDLFDIQNYRGHSLGLSSKAANRRVGVQFFQLTTSQVEKLHYLMFSTYDGKIVLRDVVTGPEVATLFLHDEEELAKSKLNLVFRALNDGDDTGLKNLCTPGLYASLKELGGNTLLQGPYRDLSQISTTPSVSLDQKSVRVVVRVGYTPPKGGRMEYDVDFERVDKDLKVVRVRDLQGGVIAMDPNIDNYLNRRYGLPDGPPIPAASVKQSDVILSLATLRSFATRELDTRNAPKLLEYAQQFLDRVPSSGIGEGFRASAEFIQAKYDDAAKDAKLAIDRGGTAYFVVYRHSSTILPSGAQFSPVALGVSRGKVEYILPDGRGVASEVIQTDSVNVQFEKNPTVSAKGLGAKARPFLSLEAAGGRKENFAAFGTACPGDPPTDRKDLAPFEGGTVCTAPQPANQPQKTKYGIPIPNIPLPSKSGTAPTVLLQTPRAWQQELKVVMDAIVQAKGGSPN